MAPLDQWITLSLLPGLGVGSIWKAMRAFGDPARILSAAPQQLAEVAGLASLQIKAFEHLEMAKRQAVEELARLADLGGCALAYDDDRYPEPLRQLADPPPVLYALGNIRLLSDCCVGVVGSRAATTYGRRTAYALARQLAGSGVVVVSGLALGIDSAAHEGALASPGKTIAVLGCGLDVVYPRQNHSLYAQVRERGLLVSEYPLSTRPDSFRFPARNRIIAGLSQGVVVVEAAKKSGSLITAQLALDLGREIFAVPGQVDSFKSEGAHWLLQQGAKLVTSAGSVLEELAPYQGLSAQGKKSETDAEIVFDLDPDAVALWQLIETYPQPRDALIERSGETAARVSELLLLLELAGAVEMLPGDMVRRPQ